MLIRVAVTAEIEPDFQSKKIMEGLKRLHPEVNYTCSHVLSIYGDKIFHCTGEGVNCVSLEEFLKTHVIVKEKILELSCSAEFYLGWNQALMDLRLDYSEGQFAGILFPHLQKFVRDGRQELICSEYQAWVNEKFGGVKYKEELDFIDPIECFEAIPEMKNA